MNWTRSTRCGNAACVEVAREPGAVHVRDTAGAVVTFEAEAWTAFVASLGAGEAAR